MRHLLMILAGAALLTACGGGVQRKTASTEVVDMHTAENSLDYKGAYKATLPAADCPGINATLTLLDNGTYTLLNSYIDRNTSFTEKGAYALDGNVMTLTPETGEGIGYYKVEEGKLRQLNSDKQVIEGVIGESYVYTKQAE